MATIRQKYFEIAKLQSEYLPKNVISELLILTNEFSFQNELFLHFDDECKNEDLLDSYIKDILKGIPFQYVVSKSHFCGLDFYVDKNVLIPRPETEELVLLAVKTIKDKFKNSSLNIVDVCTGSGCIGISFKKFFEDSNVYCCDISENALSVTKKNSEDLHLNIQVLQGNLLEPLLNKGLKFDVIISNPPYIPSKDTVSEQTLKYEPHLALFAFPSTKFYEEIFEQSQNIIHENTCFFFEIGEDMEEVLTPIVEKYFPNKQYKFIKDMYNKTRFLFIL